MECVVVKSRLISSAAYYNASGKLCVWFQTGKCAVHDNISDAVFRNLISAESPGFYYHNFISRTKKSGQVKPSPIRRLAAALILTIAMLHGSATVITAGPEELPSTYALR
jgi:hypothetical protein